MLPTTIEMIQGKRLRFARMGTGPTVLFAHGYPDNLQIWSRIVPALAGKFETIAFDWPGMGCSDAWEGGATPEHLADHLLILLDHWKIGRAAIVASDMGAQPALVFAAKYPDRVSKLVVMNCLAFADQDTSWEIHLLRQFGWNRFLLRNVPRLIFYRALTTFLPRKAPLTDEVRRDLWLCFRRREVRAYITKMCAGYQGTLPRLAEMYARIFCPALILWSGKEKHFPLVHAKKLCSTISNSRLSVIPDGTHWVFWHDSAAVLQYLIPFLNSEG